MDFNKQHNCPSNLLYCPRAFNDTVGTKLDPYTGRIMPRAKWFELYGKGNEPDWVSAEMETTGPVEIESESEP